MRGARARMRRTTVERAVSDRTEVVVRETETVRANVYTYAYICISRGYILFEEERGKAERNRASTTLGIRIVGGETG